MPRRRTGHRCAVVGHLYDGLGVPARRPACPRRGRHGRRVCATWCWACCAEAEGKDPHEAVAAANGEDAAEDEGADEGDVPVDAEPVADATAEPVPTEPQGVPNFDDEPQVAIDTEGAVAENHEASAAVFGGAATVPAGPAHEGGLPLVDGAGEDPGATVAMPAMPQE